MEKKSEKKYYAKVHRIGREKVLAICDAELLGRELSDGNITIEISEKFYGGELLSYDEVRELMKTATIINIFGEDIVNQLIKENSDYEPSVIRIANIPHLQIIRV